MKGEDVGKGTGEMVGGRYHCIMVRSIIRLHGNYFLLHGRMFDLHRNGIYAVLSQGNFFFLSINHSAVACIHVALPGMKRGGRGLLLFGDRSSIVVGGLR